MLNANGKTPSGCLAFWLLGWTVGGAFCLLTVLWQLAGREVLAVNSSLLVHRVESFGVGISRTYRTSQIKSLRATEYSSNPFTNQRAYAGVRLGRWFRSSRQQRPPA